MTLVEPIIAMIYHPVSPLLRYLTASIVVVLFSAASLSAHEHAADAATQLPPLIRTAQSGNWSDAATWEGGKLPTAGQRVQIRASHRVVYDVNSDAVIRSIHVAGTLSFAADRDTRLDVGLIKIQPGDDPSEDGFDCEVHLDDSGRHARRPALLVGTPNQPIAAEHTALIRLTYVQGQDRESCPAMVCCGGRMEFHGAPLNRTWVKLGAPAT
jgi:hypothetical protein